MNYYEQHIGDYAKDAGHLSLIEDGAYRRLIDAYYTREAPLPGDAKACCKLARAATKPERDAVAYVLAEFFTLEADGYHQKRCDEEIARYAAKQAEAGEGRAHETERKRRYRQRRAELFEQLRERGIVPAFDTPMPDLERMVSRGTSAGQTLGQDAGQTRDGTATHTPVTSHQSPVSPATDDSTAGTKGLDTLRASARATPTEVGRACLLMRQAGLVSTSPQDPRLLALLDAGATPEQCAHAAALAVSKGKGFPYALGALKGLLEDASKPVNAGKGNPEAIHERNRAIGAAWAADRAQEDPDETR